MHINPCLNFDGNCEEAFTAYLKTRSIATARLTYPL